MTPSPPTASQPVQAVSVTLTENQLRWLDARRSAGSLSRSAALRVLIDAAMDPHPRRRPAAAQSDHGTR